MQIDILTTEEISGAIGPVLRKIVREELEKRPRVEKLAVSVEQAAEMLSVSTGHIRNMIKNNELPGHKIGGEAIRIPIEAVKGLLL